MDKKAAKLAKRRKVWREIQSKGKWHFVLWTGVIRWGVGTATLWIAILTIMSSRDLNYKTLVPTAYVVFPIAGIFFGLIMWRVNHWLDKRSGNRYAIT